jgi:heat shock protein HspQ
MLYATAISIFAGDLDIDPVFANSEEWYESIPQDVRPDRDQPSTTSLPSEEDSYIAYVSQQNLVRDAEAARWTTPPCRRCSMDLTAGAIACGGA